MGTNYYKHLMGFTLTESEMEDIPYPYIELTEHVWFKSIQAFGVAGTLVLGPLAAAAKSETRNLAGVMAKSTKFGRGGVLLGLVAAPLMTYARVRDEPVEAVVDRCYRLRHNGDQVRIDRWSFMGGANGFGIAMFKRWNPTFNFLAGMTGGVVGAAIYNTTQKK